MKKQISIILLASIAGIACAESADTSESSAALKSYLKKYPASDSDGDGILTETEHTRYLPQPSLKKFGANSVHRHVEIPMRDGHTLSAEVYLPGNGDGTWPVLLTRAEYSRWWESDIPKTGLIRDSHT